MQAIMTSGHIVYDGLDIKFVGLESLRSNIAFIPQQPELMNGTLRENLDPFGRHADATLNDALRSACLHETQPEDSESQINLDTEIRNEGGNISQGQRQIIAVARALLRRNRLVIIDEGTAAIGE